MPKNAKNKDLAYDFIDLMLSEDGVPYVIEVNSVPGMTELSLVPDAGRAMGIEFPELCERILLMAGFEK